MTELEGAELAAFAAARPVPEELSPLVRPGALVVHGAPAGVDAAWLEGVPAVTVLVGDGDETPAGFDVYLTGAADPPAPWVCAPLAPLVDAVDAQPLVALAAASLYRASAGLDVWRGLAAESATYSALLASGPFREWRAARPARPVPAAAEPPVLVQRLDACLRIVLNRPRVHNAVDSAMRDALVEALGVAVADPSVEQVELAGAGPSFCSGGDLEEFGTVGDPATAHAVRLTRHPARWVHLCADRVAVRAHGACLGAGIELASFARTVTAAPDAYFGLPEVSMGLVPGAGGTVGIPRRIGRPRAVWLTLTGARITSSTALAWGLVDEVGD
ncbi:MAG TPA: enoyl-CoA hydratase/isomerase family protein [Acidimicrobiales bacterium]|nr:enoyl-CoA hydratase/isomerase family protein [Acidimicrobiales bacterium]